MYPIEYRWMNIPTPVTNNTIVSDSGSASSAAFTCSPPDGIQVNSSLVKERWSAARCSSDVKTRTPVTNEPTIIAVANHPDRRPSLRPRARSTTNPASGNAGISQTALSTRLSPQRVDVVGGGARPAPEDGHDDPEAHDDLGRRDHEHEEHDGLSADVVE